MKITFYENRHTGMAGKRVGRTKDSVVIKSPTLTSTAGRREIKGSDLRRHWKCYRVEVNHGDEND